MRFTSEGRRAEAQEQYEQVLSIARDLGDRRTEGLTMGNLVHLQADQGHVAAAMELFEKALRLLREAGFRAPEATFLAAMAEAEDEAGRPEAARHGMTRRWPLPATSVMPGEWRLGARRRRR